MPDEVEQPDVADEAGRSEIPKEDEPVKQRRIGSDRNPGETLERAVAGDEEPPRSTPTL